MCGFFCAIDKKKFFFDSDILLFNKSLSIIDYRGPDNTSYSLLNSKNADQNANIFLGHNRLSIIDLNPNSNQPYTYNNDYHIIYNGEIYNYLELKGDLEKEGIVFKTNSDTEVLIALYVHKGIESFSLLNGMWSFVIYDSIKNKVICSRDRFGEKPFYYYEDGFGRVYFASEIKQLLPFAKSKPNMVLMYRYLVNYLLDDTNETFFEQIYKLPPSHNMTIDLNTGVKNIYQYWNFKISDYNNNYNENDLIQEYRDLFFDSVKIRMRSDVKIGNTLSGGLDSSSIAVVAASRTNSEFQNFSVISSTKRYSEEYFVNKLILDNNLKVQKLNYDYESPWIDAEKVIWHHDEPILSISTIAHYQMMKLLNEKSDIVVVLSGQGGDESLAGYNKYYFYAIKEKFKNKKYFSGIIDSLNLIPKISGEFSLNASRRYTGFGGKQKKDFDSILKGKKINIDLNNASSFKERQILDFFKYSVPPLCHYEDRNSMAFSKEIRLPFLDYRLAEFSVNLPLEMKIKNGFSKYILRKAIPELPFELRTRKDKKGFSLDESIYFTGSNKNLILNTFKNSFLEELGIIDKSALLRSYNNGNPQIWVRDLGRLVFAEMWLKKFFA